MTDNEVLYCRSSENARKPTEGDSSANEDIWDDTLLIKAYDEAVHIVQESLKKKKQNGESNPSRKKGVEKKWKVGDQCRCQYSQDLRYYEADIIEIYSSTGMCTVRYVGYENEELVPLKNLKPSKGDSVRAKQLNAAAEEYGDENETEFETNTAGGNTGKKTRPVQKKSFAPKKEHFSKNNDFTDNDILSSLNFPLPQLASSIFPPPPPPHVFNKVTEDENETEAMSAMLMSWYMSGYHTGYYQGLKMAKSINRN